MGRCLKSIALCVGLVVAGIVCGFQLRAQGQAGATAQAPTPAAGHAPADDSYRFKILLGGGYQLGTQAFTQTISFDQFQEHGYRVVSATTVANNKKPGRFIYTDALWHGGDMIGLGVSSFSHFGGVHFQNAHSFEEYVRLLDSDQLPLLRALSLTPKQKLIREMILQLKGGALDTAYFLQKFGVEIWNEFEPVYERLDAAGLLERTNGKIELTRSGLLQVDGLLSEFFEPEMRAARYA